MKEKYPKIYLLTAHYPFGKGETFLEDEMRTIECNSNNITIISGEVKHKTEKRFFPEQIKCICFRKRRYVVSSLVISAMRLVLPETWEEIKFASKTFGYNISKIEMVKQIFIYYYVASELKRTISKLDIPDDAVFYSYWMTEPAFFLSEYKKTHPNAICICRTHGSDCFADKFYQPFRREILEGIDMIFPISEAGKKSIDDLLLPYVNEKKCASIVVQRLGVIKNNEFLNPSKQNDEFCIVTCSNVISLKRLDLMIEALALMKEEKIHWVHFGDGDQMNSIRKFADEKLQGGLIQYDFFGYVNKKEILSWYENHHVDIIVNCSDSEGIPVSIMEAFSYGIPAIARDVGGIAELVQNEENGILLPTKCDAEQLKSAIIRIKYMKDVEIKSLRVKSYETYLQKYNALENYKNFYKEISSFADK